jgi:hypothetical protein
MNYLNGGGPWKLIAEHTEVESGRRNARPELSGWEASWRECLPPCPSAGEANRQWVSLE